MRFSISRLGNITDWEDKAEADKFWDDLKSDDLIQDVLYMTEGMDFRACGSWFGLNFTNNCEHRYSGREVPGEVRSERTRNLGKRLQIQSTLVVPCADTLVAAYNTAFPYAVSSKLETAPRKAIQ